jgi:hypothetical protein
MGYSPQRSATWASRLARARELGLSVVPGAYIERPKSVYSPRGEYSSPADDDERAEPLPHLVHCPSCAISYRLSHYHCCACHHVFRTAHSFEVHAKGSAGPLRHT